MSMALSGSKSMLGSMALALKKKGTKGGKRRSIDASGSMGLKKVFRGKKEKDKNLFVSASQGLGQTPGSSAGAGSMAL